MYSMWGRHSRLGRASLLLLLAVSPGEGVRSVGTRTDVGDLGSLGCRMVKGARSREGFHFMARCKCAGEVSVLSEGCGDQADERKFDITRLPIEVDANGKSSIHPDCRCRVQGMHERNSRSGIAEVSREMGEKMARGSEEPDEATPPQGLAAACERFDAVPREGLFRGCKCAEESYLSLGCGKKSGLRKFNPKHREVQNDGCRCVSDGDLMRNTSFAGELDEENEPAAETTTAPSCKVPPPPGFAFGDTVRIVKMVKTGHLIEVLGIGLLPQSRPAKVSGTIAQVVCSEDTSATKGRVCLRKGAANSKSVGCWLPANLEKVE